MTEGSPELNRDGTFARARAFILHDLWQMDLGPRSVTASLLRLLQFGVMVAEGFVQDRLLLRASALTFMTALSAMPLLVVLVALVGLVGGQDTLIDYAVSQATAVSPEAHRWILSRIQEVHIGSLGTLGGATLVISAVLALRHLESTLGDIWGVRQNRSWPRRFADYLAVLVVAPILTGVAVSLWASLGSEVAAQGFSSLPVVGWIHDLNLIQLPQILIWATFAFLYWFFPNTQVNIRSAIVGGLVAMLLFTLTRVVYVDMSVGAARYSVLFGGLVALPLVLTWLYICWAVVLFGAEIAYAHQNIAHYREELKRAALPPAEKEFLAVRVMVAIASTFARHEAPRTCDALALQLEVPVRTLRELLDELEQAGIVIAAGLGERAPAYLPARPLKDTSVADILGAIRRSRAALNSPEPAQKGTQPSGDTRLEPIFEEMDSALARIAGSHSLLDLIDDI
ncbi:MAG: YhjD/YihY/BrkB family envelope integrity protein [Myxococcota bacterium]|nr:YhjD/YihY/BrkB family envelope integrity protein [Myxococcota bacterium]